MYQTTRPLITVAMFSDQTESPQITAPPPEVTPYQLIHQCFLAMSPCVLHCSNRPGHHSTANLNLRSILTGSGHNFFIILQEKWNYYMF